ncbi:MAG: KH domain-containing protein [Clostridia bacterium]|nr:KH domain-containing protein [Clostridia bacterium]MBQ4561429.1 KH domain-containing protein [Clostridia bacterium]MBR4882179.1 KH domain-containing protein [Clostridia bacterium]MBR6513329.1 KH domain-containing protein [Clostridia bacterium]
MKTILADMVKPIVVYPDQVVITEEVKGDTVTLTLNVEASDMGKVIGKHGKIARSLRLIMKAAATQCGKKVNVEIRD